MTTGIEIQVAESRRRRIPLQQRSRVRVNRMLQAASDLIAEGGSVGLGMSDVADRAGVSIGSLYQYFPDKRSIVWTLAENFYTEGRSCVIREFETVTDRASFRLALLSLVDGYYGMFLDDPAMLDIWSGIQADKALQELDLKENREVGALIADVIMRIDPTLDPVGVVTRAFMIANLICAAVRLAISVDRDEGAKLIASFKSLINNQFASGS